MFLGSLIALTSVVTQCMPVVFTANLHVALQQLDVEELGWGADVSPTRRFADRRFADKLFDPETFRLHGSDVSPTHFGRFADNPSDVSPTNS